MGPLLLFFRFLFDYFMLDPQSYWDFQETGLNLYRPHFTLKIVCARSATVMLHVNGNWPIKLYTLIPMRA